MSQYKCIHKDTYNYLIMINDELD